MRRPCRRAAPFAVLIAASVLWALALGGPALAHAGLERASPEDDETVPRPPQEVRLTFNETVRAEFDPLEVYGPGGERVDAGDAGTDPEDPAAVAVPLKEGLPAGDYRVEWRVTSADGDPIDGEYRFTARGGAPEVANSEGGDGPGGGQAPKGTDGGPGSSAASNGQAVVYGAAGVAIVVLAAVALLLRRRA